ncbi:11387_t:CDS:2 [Ambispora leptoticha]|uniref:11387_t:CDS:1 n=1 Tax=Ambispora leptoticha TaxID=144679 RepID=A0A9N9DMB5_9GLOM|nr:11387_t:CDS:2 [Ambispora leptoticha]
MAKTLNEGTYQFTVIVLLLIRAVLKNLPLGPSSFISTSERQSIASADRRGDGQTERRPDIMFVIKYLDVFFELMYVECSRLFCTQQKKVDDDIKLWRECKDGMYYTRKTLNPEKDQFGIVGVQIAGDILHLNILIRNKANVHKYYHIQSAKILVQFSDENVVITFVETLLRNILITNISQLCHGSTSTSQRLMEDKEYAENEADIAKLKTGLQYPILFERIKTTILELETRNAKLKPIIEEFTKKSESSHLVIGKKIANFRLIQIAKEILNEEPIIEYCPSFLNGLELDAFFQKYQIALEEISIGFITLAGIRMLKNSKILLIVIGEKDAYVKIMEFFFLRYGFDMWRIDNQNDKVVRDNSEEPLKKIIKAYPKEY